MLRSAERAPSSSRGVSLQNTSKKRSTNGPRAVCLVIAVGMVAPLAIAGEPGIYPGYLENQGFEHIIAGPGVDPDYGFVTNPDYYVDEIAISGDGLRIWFVLYNFFEDPQYEVWSILSDGTFAAQSELGEDTVTPANLLGDLYVNTDLDGDVAIFDSKTQFSRATPGNDLELLFGRDDFGAAAGQLRVTDDASRLLYLDFINDEIHSVDLEADPIVSVPIAPPATLAYEGLLPRNTEGFDMSSDGIHWFTTAENYDPSISWARYWVPHGEGFDEEPDMEFEDMPFVSRQIYQVEVSDDGGRLAYCPRFELAESGICYFQQVGSTERMEITEDGRFLGGQVMSDDGRRLYVLSDFPFNNSYGFFETLGRHKRRVGGTQRLAGKPYPEFQKARLSDDGRVLVAPVPLGLYVLHDGSDIPLDFPQLSAITHFFDGDELVVQVFLNAPMGIERIFTLPLYRGMEPTRSLPEAENPLYRERNGGGVNWNTTFSQLGPTLWERRIILDGKADYLNQDFSLRIVVVDHTGYRTSYYDFAPSITFADGFESGDTSAWSSTVP